METNVVTDKRKETESSSTHNTSIGTITEPELFGPSEPGTSVTLNGVVLQETDGGMLVVNVAWNGKSYAGSLLNCTNDEWGPPRPDKADLKKKKTK